MADEYTAEQRKAQKLLPAWFVPRMMDDVWRFALLMSNGTLIHITRIDKVVEAKDGSLWLDVELCREVPFQAPKEHKGPHLIAPTSRLMASINAAHVTAAFETADT